MTIDSAINDETIKTDLAPEALKKANTTRLHFKNWVEAVQENRPEMCNNTPDFGDAVAVTVILGAMNYRNGKVNHFDVAIGTYSDGNLSWAQPWKKLSYERGQPKHFPGGTAGGAGCRLRPPDYQRLAGPWIGGRDPAG